MKNILLSILFYLMMMSHLMSMSEDYEKKLYWGCYPSSKQYLGAEKANLYCTCTVKKLSKEFTNEEMDEISGQSSEKQLEIFNFASTLCGKELELN